MGEDHLLLYIVLALCERLTKPRTEPFVARTISALDAALPVARPVTLS
jgi:hypothetical protein